jgi:hypothetical protein
MCIIMKPEIIEQRLKDIRNEIHSLDSLRDGNDDINIHIIEDEIELLQVEQCTLEYILDNHFDTLIGL